MTKRAALILAGGKALRFQTKYKDWEDKALAEISEKPLLIHAMENARQVADELVVCVDTNERRDRYTKVIEKYAFANAQIVVDEQIWPVNGPNLAILSGLNAVHADYCLTLPCDMPFLEPPVADYLFEEAADFEVSIPMWPNGRLETLLMVLQRQNTLEVVKTLCQLTRPRSDDITRGSSKTLLASPVNHIKTLDPELKSFININTKNDLSKPQTRPTRGKIRDDLKFCLGNQLTFSLRLLRQGGKMLENGVQEELSEAEKTFAFCTQSFESAHFFFWAAVSAEKQGEALLESLSQGFNPESAINKVKESFLRAAKNYLFEAHFFEMNGCPWLAQRALADKVWCELRTTDQSDRVKKPWKTTRAKRML